MIGTDVEIFASALRADFVAAIRAMALVPTPAGLVGWTSEQVLEQFDKSEQVAIAAAKGTP